MLSWLTGGQSLQELIAKKKWDKAVEQLRNEIKNSPRDARTRMQLADVLVEAGRGQDAVPILLKLAQEFGSEGSAPRAIAVLKKIERIQPGRSDVQRALAALIKSSTKPTPVSSGIEEIVRGSDQFEMEEIGLDLRPSQIEPSEFMFQAPKAIAPPPPSTPEAVRSAPPPPPEEEEEEQVEMEDLVMPPPRTLIEVAAAAPPPSDEAQAPRPQPQVVQVSEAASMIAAMNDTDKGLFDGLLDTIEQVLAEAPAALEPQTRTRVSSPLFADFSEEDLVAVIQGLELATFGPGDILILEGDPGTSLFVVTSGVVRAFVKQKDGKNKQVREMGEGSFFGEIAVLSGKPRTATVTAKTPVEALILERKTLDNIVKTHPSVRVTLQKFAAERLKTGK